MTNLTRFHTADMPQLFDRILKNSIGMDDYFDRFMNETTSNYPPYNLIQVNNVESRLEVALAGFKKDELNVFTEFGKLYVEAKKEDSETVETFVHQGLAKRSFTRVWTITDDTEIRDVQFRDGLLVVEPVSYTHLTLPTIYSV